MSAPTVRVVARPITTAAALHPLATRAGIELLGLALAAREHWQPLTKRQRAVLRVTAHTALAAIPPDLPAEGIDIELPELPAETHPATARSLERRGLAAGGRITPLGVQVVQHGDHDVRPIRPSTRPAAALARTPHE